MMIASYLAQGRARLEQLLSDLEPMIEDAELERAEYVATDLASELCRRICFEQALLPIFAQRTLLVRAATVMQHEHVELEHRLAALLTTFQGGHVDSVRASFAVLAGLIREHTRRANTVLAPLLDEVLGPIEGGQLVARMNEKRS